MATRAPLFCLFLLACSGEVTPSDVVADDDSAATATYISTEYGVEHTLDYSGSDYWTGIKFNGALGDQVEIVVTPLSPGADAYVRLSSGKFVHTLRDAPGSTLRLIDTLSASGTYSLGVHNDAKSAARFTVVARRLGPSTAPSAEPKGAHGSSLLFASDLFKAPAATPQDLAKGFAPGTTKLAVGTGAFVTRQRVCQTQTGCSGYTVNDYHLWYASTSPPVSRNVLPTSVFNGTLIADKSEIYLKGEYRAGANPFDPSFVIYIWPTAMSNSGGFAGDCNTGSPGRTSSLLAATYAVGMRECASKTDDSGKYVEYAFAYFNSLVPGGTLNVKVTDDRSDVRIDW